MEFKKSLQINSPDEDIMEAIARSKKAYNTPPASPKSINEIIKNQSSKPELQKICEQINSRENLKVQCFKHLPEQFHEQIKGVSLEKHTLNISVSHAAVATKLTYIKMDLLESLRKEGFYSLISIQIKVQP